MCDSSFILQWNTLLKHSMLSQLHIDHWPTYKMWETLTIEAENGIQPSAYCSCPGSHSVMFGQSTDTVQWLKVSLSNLQIVFSVWLHMGHVNVEHACWLALKHEYMPIFIIFIQIVCITYAWSHPSSIFKWSKCLTTMLHSMNMVSIVTCWSLQAGLEGNLKSIYLYFVRNWVTN